MKKKKKSQSGGKIDYSLMFIIIFLLCFGLVMLYSTSSYNALIKYGDAAYYLKKQVFATVIGIAVMLFLAYTDYHWLKKVAILAYFGSMVAICLVKTSLGYSANGATRWISIMGISIQPAEVAKIAVIILLAAVITKNRNHIGELGCTLNVAALSLPLC